MAVMNRSADAPWPSVARAVRTVSAGASLPSRYAGNARGQEFGTLAGGPLRAVPVVVTPVADLASARALAREMGDLSLTQKVELQEYSLAAAHYTLHTYDQTGLIQSLVRWSRLQPVNPRFLAGNLALTLSAPWEAPPGAGPVEEAKPPSRSDPGPSVPSLRLMKPAEAVPQVLSEAQPAPAPDAVPALGWWPDRPTQPRVVAASVKVQVDAFFNARHEVALDGASSPVHSHSWRVQCEIKGDFDEATGVLVPFAAVKRILQTAVEGYNDTLLNEVQPFDRVQPTSENIAATLYRKLARAVQPMPARLVALSVWESPTSCITYSEGE